MRVWLLLIANLTASVSVGIGMVIAPWLPGKTAEGGSMLSGAAMLSGILLCFLMPWIGFIVDRTSVRMMLAAMGLYFFTCVTCQIFLSFSHVSRSALIKTVFAAQTTRKINSLME
ncbi:hypothetical protein [Neisseria leonii]|uniref:hypothetical protein n=1 Tax=Neisseria leonii TaxID=2995413 RepID=UPI00237AD9A9|nr:hypothetical protein [Neisseria sp. 3986]MDD9326120.1 hypothetical protein [Neisseria sp. 3986]